MTQLATTPLASATTATPSAICADRAAATETIAPWPRSPRVAIGGALIDNVTMDEAIDQLHLMIARRTPSFIVTPNVDHIVRLQTNVELRAAYRDAALVLADGMPLLWASRFLGTPLRDKVSGSDVLPRFCSAAAGRGYRLFFLGGRPGAAQQSAQVLSARHPGLDIQVHCPPMGFERDESQNRSTVQLIREARPDIVFVALGAPKQELWIHRHYQQYAAPVSVGIGGTFEFVSGLVARAPRVLQKTGLEWLWRLVLEPRRMYRRYLLDDPVFFGLIWKQRRLAARVRRLHRPASMATDNPLAPGQVSINA